MGLARVSVNDGGCERGSVRQWARVRMSVSMSEVSVRADVGECESGCGCGRGCE